MSDLISQKDLSEKLNLSRSTIYRLRKNDGLPYYEVGGKVLFDFPEVKQWLKSKQNK